MYIPSSVCGFIAGVVVTTVFIIVMGLCAASKDNKEDEYNDLWKNNNN